MSLFKSLYNKLHPESPPGDDASTPETRAEAADALQKASTDLNAAINRNPQVAEVASALRDQLERNHFGELVEASMRRAS